MNLQTRVILLALVVTLSGCDLQSRSRDIGSAPMRPAPENFGLPPDAVEVTKPGDTTAADEKLADQYIGKWNGLVRLPPNSGVNLRQMQAEQTAFLAKYGGLSLDLAEKRQYNLRIFGYTVTGDYTIEDGYLVLHPATVQGKIIDEVKEEGSKSDAEKENHPVPDLIAKMNFEISSEYKELIYDQGAAVTQLIFTRKVEAESVEKQVTSGFGNAKIKVDKAVDKNDPTKPVKGE
jgi:hypothetical protein